MDSNLQHKAVLKNIGLSGKKTYGEGVIMPEKRHTTSDLQPQMVKSYAKCQYRHRLKFNRIRKVIIMGACVSSIRCWGWRFARLRPSRYLRAAGPCLLYGAAVAAMMVCGCGKRQKPPERPPALVSADDVNVADVPQYLDEIGTCTAFASVTVRPQVTGQLATIEFVDGADVKKGQLLFTIDDRTFKAALSQAQANLGQNRASLNEATREYERAKTLIPSAAISQEQYQSRESVMVSAEAQVHAGEAAVEVAQVNLDYCYIHSPIDGRASLRQVDVGNIVTSGGSGGNGGRSGSSNTGSATGGGGSGTALLLIQTMHPIYVDFTVTERDIPDVRAMMSHGTLTALVRLPGERQEEARAGKVTFLDNAVLPASGTVRLRATLENADLHFWPGQFVRVRLILQTLKDVALVPAASVQISQDGPYVYVIEPNMTARLTLVRTGQQQGEMLVVDGLEGGEKVVTGGQIGVTPGGRVQIAGQAPPAGNEGKRGKGRQ
jgi:membrane fusion protein, multidrug efflux system